MESHLVSESIDSIKNQACENGELLQIRSTNVAFINLQHLVEDCLFEIFFSKTLNLMDLCCLAETCIRFQEIIANRMVRLAKGLSVEIISRCFYKFKLGYYAHLTGTCDEFERIFKDFRSSLRSVSICSYNRQNEENFLFNLVATYCVDVLEWLLMDFLTISDVAAVTLCPIFQQLQVLDLVDVQIDCDSALFADFPLLVTLRVTSVRNCGAILVNKFPKLKRFEYQKYRIVPGDKVNDPSSEQTMKTLATFISCHATLKSLDLRFVWSYEECTKNILEDIDTNGNKLKKLSFKIESTYLCSLQPLQTFEHSDGLKPFTALRELNLCYWTIPNDLCQFAALAQLTKLSLSDCLFTGVFDVAGMIGHLKVLEELSIYWALNQWTQLYFKLDNETFSKILHVVGSRPNVLTLRVECNRSFNLENHAKSGKIRLLPIRG